MSEQQADFFVHPSAEVSADANIGKGTKIWHQCQVMRDASVGENCILGKSVYVDFGVSLGNGVKVQNGVSIYRGVSVSDECFLGPHMVFTNDLFPRAFNDDFTITPTHLERGASVGANATLVCGITLGEFSMVGAGSVATRDVPAHALVVGNPARQIGWVCRCGERLDANPNQAPVKCKRCGEVTDLT